MTELKQAIDELTEKVTSLEAELHVAQESLEAKDEEITVLETSLTAYEICARLAAAGLPGKSREA